MHHLFQFPENTFSLRNFRELVIHNEKISNYGLKTVSYRVSILWAKLLSEYKNTTSLSKIKAKIKNWEGDEIWPSRLCKIYLPSVGYIWYDKSMESYISLSEFYTEISYTTFIIYMWLFWPLQKQLSRGVFHNRILNSFLWFLWST